MFHVNVKGLFHLNNASGSMHPLNGKDGGNPPVLQTRWTVSMEGPSVRLCVRERGRVREERLDNHEKNVGRVHRG
ncbi:hypothetical protein LptCag_2292 [Leptospirillum ferriphilum]|uniref:Uncharacterized protein n=1 Tax=Leptospirillum ferriphilum TaxID=178606 RepID=A0A094WBD0_9BACT|nr:hypothetical protein LptCag_2292 [Leptospirillum ferriphilum]